MISSVLIANRGEIAVRIVRTCRRLGVRSVAVYSTADAHSQHVRMADEASLIGPAPAAQSYLNQHAILDSAQRAGVEAIHPGYGFLAENAEFAAACIEAGLIWIGPPPAAMRALGDKAHAKTLAERSGVPTLPGYHGEDQSAQTLGDEARRIGVPLLIKASAGGGGRGMRLVEDLHEFPSALEAARREAMSSFGDDRILLERYVRRPRHVEIQIFGDRHGTLLHLGERECSIQRRNQKLIEETPSPAVDASLRLAMGEAAVRLARAADYTNAGTVEFILDEQRRFWFLEVNARLQVEHPITEAVTGLDLVELQLRVAAGESLGLSQSDIRLDGHALEARIVAEDALASWTPSSGTIDYVSFPATIRVDGWIEPGTPVSPYYDSLLAKVIAHTPSREASVALLADAMRRARLDGVRDNLDLLLAVLEHPAFRAGDLHTGFLDAQRIVESLAVPWPQALAAAAVVDVLAPRLEPDPWQLRSGWRLGRLDQPIAWQYAGRRHDVRVTQDLVGDGARISIGTTTLGARLLDRDADVQPVRVEGELVLVRDVDDHLRVVETRARSYRLQRVVAVAIQDGQASAGSAGAPGQLTAPMPGRVVKVGVRTGEEVVQNQVLLVMEAMKMEHVIEAPHAGTVAEVCVQAGEQVAAGALLLVIGSAAADTAADEPS